MDADLQRTLLVHAATELASGERLPLADLATATGLALEEVAAVVDELAAQDLVEVEDGPVVRVTEAGMAETGSTG